MKDLEMLVSYGDKPITKLVIKCPSCGKWFNQSDISDVRVKYESELRLYTSSILDGRRYNDFLCPNCGYTTCNDNDIVRISTKETDEFPKVAEKKIIWE